MTRPWRSLRVQLALVGFLAIYVPVLLLFGVTFVTETETTETLDGGEIVADTTVERSPWVILTVVALGPAAAGLAWWWAGRAVRPIERVRMVAEDIEGSDLSRRIGLDQGSTELIALAASFDAMLERLEHAAETQRQLVEEASHELRTPLAVLATNVDVTLAHPAPTVDVYRQGLERTRRATDRLRSTIDELLVDARGRARTLDRQPADLMTIGRAVVDDASVIATAAQVDISLDGPPTAVCRLDEATVRRAITNLVDNAVRHAPPGSTVEISVDVSDTDATVVVTDHGPGVSADEQGQIFERFERGRGGTPGTGLGLPIARQIALAHGGDLTVTSPGAAGDGCEFRLRLRR